MKLTILALILISSTFSFENQHHYRTHLQGELDSASTEIGKERSIKLSNLRNSLLTNVKAGNTQNLNTIILEGDTEFSNYPWITIEERLFLYLILGEFNEIINDYSLRKIIWLGNQYNSYLPKISFPQFCIDIFQDQFIPSMNFDYAPDLLNHLKFKFKRDKEYIFKGMSSYKDLYDFLKISECEDKIFNQTNYYNQNLPKHQLKILREYVEKHPNSNFSKDIDFLPPTNYKLTGNGFLSGAGPRFDVFDSESQSVIKNGLNGGLFVEARFPLLVTTANFQFREFTSRRDVRLKDTTFSQGASLNLFRFQGNIGLPFVIGRKIP